MTAMLLPLPSGRVTHSHGVWHVLSDLVEGIAHGHRMAQRYQALSRKTDAELARMGLTRADIPAAVVKGL